MSVPDPVRCAAEAAGYDGMFGISCSLPDGHEGLHNDDDWVEWDFVDPSQRNSKTPAQAQGVTEERN